MTHVLFVAALAVGLEACRIGWHGPWRKHLLPVLGHALCAAALGWQVYPGVAPLAALLVWPSYAVWPRPGEVPSGWWWRKWAFHLVVHGARLDAIPERRWGRCWRWDNAHVLSALSSWPVELAAITAVTAPLWGDWLPFTGACALWLAVAALCKWAIWRNPALRPSHWT